MRPFPIDRIPGLWRWKKVQFSTGSGIYSNAYVRPTLQAGRQKVCGSALFTHSTTKSQLLSKQPYTYSKHFVPHDASAHELSTGLSRVEVARGLGFHFTVANRLPVMEGIDATRSIFNRCWFDEKKCQKCIVALENYKKEWNERLGGWDSKPLHNRPLAQLAFFKGLI